MASIKPIDTAPKDGSKVTVVWTDFDGQKNESPARYRSLEKLKAAGGEWDAADEGWWVFTDSTTQKKVVPSGWVSDKDETDD